MKRMLKIAVFFVFALGLFNAFAKPSRIEDLRGWSTNGGFVVSWTVPNPEAGTTLTNMVVKYSTSPINTLNWSSPANTTIAWLTDPGTPGTSQIAVVTDLTANTPYYIAIKTQDSNGQWSTVSNLALVTSGDTTYQISVAWDPNSEPDLAGYRVKYGTSVGGPRDVVIDVGLVTRYSITNLLYGATYYIAVTAYNEAGLESDESDEISYPP